MLRFLLFLADLDLINGKRDRIEKEGRMRVYQFDLVWAVLRAFGLGLCHSLLPLSACSVLWLSEAELPLKMGDKGGLCLCPPPLCYCPATVLFSEGPQGQEARSRLWKPQAVG